LLKQVSDWKKINFADIIVDMKGGGTPSTTNPALWNGNIPWTRSAAIKSRYITKGEKMITIEGLENSATNLVPKDNLLIASRVSIGNVGINKIDIAISQDLTGIIVDTAKADVEYLYWFLSKSKQLLVSLAQGSTIQGITKEDLKNIELPLPPLTEQKKIASILSKVDELIHKSEEIIEQTQRLKKGLTQTLLTKGVGHKSFKTVKFLYGKELAIPEEWQVQRIDSLVRDKNDIKTGPFGSSLKKEFFVSKGYKIYGQEQVISDNFEIGNYYIPEDLFIKMKNYEIRPMDVLISLVGTHGKVSVVPSNIERGIINPRLLKVTFDQSVALPEFMKIVLSSKLTDMQIQRLSHGLTMDILNLGLMKKIIFFVPSVAEQQRIVNIISTVENLLSKYQDYLQRLSILEKGLMQKLLTGKIRVKV
jgi:type I restriction enzyme S subunit